MGKFEFLKLSLATTFGGKSRRPVRTASLKFIALAGGLSAMMALWMGAISKIPISDALPKIWWLAIIVIGIQLLSGFTLLLGQAVLPSRANLTRLLVVLPVTKRVRWFVINAPAIFLQILLVLTLAQPMVWLANRAKLGTWTLAAVLIGTISGFGLANYRTGLQTIPRFFLSGIVAAGELLLIKRITGSYMSTGMVGNNEYLTLLLLIFVPIFWLALSAEKVVEDIHLDQKRQAWNMRYRFNWLWHLSKFLRNHRSGSSFLIGFVISFVLAVSIFTRTSGVEPQALLFVTAILGSSLASDIRSSLRRTAPPEIVALYGTGYLMVKQIVTSLIVPLFATLPLGIGLVLAADAPVSAAVEFMSLVIFSGSVGLFVSEVLANGIRDITGQITGSVLCLALLIGLPKIIPVPELYTDIARITLAVSLFGLSYLVERIRNNYYWKRASHAR